MKKSTSEPRAIVLKLPTVENTCMLAVPFADQFKQLSDSISLVASSLGLKPIRTDEQQAQPTFPEDILARIRAARIVVCVCVCDDAGAFNPNVIFELGLARAMAKPTVLVTNDVDQLPANFFNLYATAYDDTVLFDSENFELRLKQKMRDLLERSDGGVIDSSVPNVSLAYSKNPATLDGTFLQAFKTIYQFIREVEEILQLHTTKLDDLLRVGHELRMHRPFPEPGDSTAMADTPNSLVAMPSLHFAFRGDQGRYIREIDRKWREFQTFHAAFAGPHLFDTLSRSSDLVHRSFDEIGTLLDVEGHANLNTLREFYVLLDTLLKDYLGQYQHAAKKDIKLIDFEDSQELSLFVITLGNLLRVVEKSILQARAVMHNLTMLLFYP